MESYRQGLGEMLRGRSLRPAGLRPSDTVHGSLPFFHQWRPSLPVQTSFFLAQRDRLWAERRLAWVLNGIPETIELPEELEAVPETVAAQTSDAAVEAPLPAEPADTSDTPDTKPAAAHRTATPSKPATVPAPDAHVDLTPAAVGIAAPVVSDTANVEFKTVNAKAVPAVTTAEPAAERETAPRLRAVAADPDASPAPAKKRIPVRLAPKIGGPRRSAAS